MTQNEIIEGNKFIAEFMGAKMIVANYHGINIIEFPDKSTKDLVGLKYHSSWDWLMSCIGKLSNQCEEPEELDNLKYALLCNDIDTAFNFVVDYIRGIS
jgi:hypothetical protein